MLKMEVCSVCGKRMPPHILIKHLAKTHGLISETKIDGTIVNFDKKLSLESITQSPEPEKWYDLWDAGEIRTCAQCKSEWPDKLMGFHLKSDHGL